MTVYLINPSHVSFGIGVITPRWLYVLAAATPPSAGEPRLIDETLESFDPAVITAGDVVGIGIHTGNALRGYEIGTAARAAGAYVVYGGIHASLYPDEARDLGGAHAVVTGDGDALSIGGNHLIHALRRNVNLKILLFNNRIYGLTKGQYSPTSELGKVTKSTPMGSLDYPFNPLSVAIGAEASFVGRAIDTDKKGLAEVVEAAARHRGSAFVEILQNCNIYNDGAFDYVRDEKANRIYLEDGAPIRFGDAVIDVERGEARMGDQEVKLTRLEFDLVRYFAANPGRVLSRQELQELAAHPQGKFEVEMARQVQADADAGSRYLKDGFNCFKGDSVFSAFLYQTEPMYQSQKQTAERLQRYLDLRAALLDRFGALDYVDLKFDERVYVRGQRQGVTGSVAAN